MGRTKILSGETIISERGRKFINKGKFGRGVKRCRKEIINIGIRGNGMNTRSLRRSGQRPT